MALRLLGVLICCWAGRLHSFIWRGWVQGQWSEVEQDQVPGPVLGSQQPLQLQAEPEGLERARQERPWGCWWQWLNRSPGGQEGPGQCPSPVLALLKPTSNPGVSFGPLTTRKSLRGWSVSREGNRAEKGAQPGEEEAQGEPCGSSQLPDRRG